MNTARTKLSPRRERERGSVLAYTVLSVLFLFFAVGLGVDLSHLYTVKAELQNAADAAALAGASALTLDNNTKIQTATNRAVTLLNRNKYNFDNKEFVAGAADVASLSSLRQYVRFAKNLSDFDSGNGMSEAQAIAAPSGIRFVRVVTPSVPVSIFFSVPLLGSAVNLDARAVAGLSIPGNVNFCIAPLSAVSCDPGDSNCSLCDPDDPLYPNCDWSKYWGKCPINTPQNQTSDPYAIQTLERTNADGTTSTYQCDPKREFCDRCTYNIRSEGQNNQGPAAGNFQILRCAGNGANVVRQALAEYGTNCRCGAVSPDQDVETQTGVDAGAVRQGLNVRFDVYEGGLRYGTNMPPDTNIAQGGSTGQGSNEVWEGISFAQYSGNQVPPEPSVAPVGPSPSHPGVAGRRVLIIPIIPLSSFTDETGNQTVKVGRLGGFFMRAQVSGGNGGDIQAEYIGDKIVDVIGYDPNDDTTSNVVTPVLYR
jgi:Flp pilus assembly protein TadG